MSEASGLELLDLKIPPCHLKLEIRQVQVFQFIPPHRCYKSPALCIKRTNKCESFSAQFRWAVRMQAKTNNNALLALYRTGESRVHVAAFMTLRGIPAPKRVHDKPLVRGKCKRLALSLLPCTTSVVASAIQRELPDITRKSAVNRAYQVLLRLKAKGLVVRGFELDGCLWRLAP
jgi:hypothetical protein